MWTIISGRCTKEVNKHLSVPIPDQKNLQQVLTATRTVQFQKKGSWILRQQMGRDNGLFWHACRYRFYTRYGSVFFNRFTATSPFNNKLTALAILKPFWGLTGNEPIIFCHFLSSYSVSSHYFCDMFWHFLCVLSCYTNDDKIVKRLTVKMGKCADQNKEKFIQITV